jgi:Resolvase, N terminal domain/Recombinase
MGAGGKPRPLVGSAGRGINPLLRLPLWPTRTECGDTGKQAHEDRLADNPHANKLTVHILAAVAQHEREMIAQRTKDALQAAKARGNRGIARALAARGIRTARGGEWSAVQVNDILRRA